MDEDNVKFRAYMSSLTVGEHKNIVDRITKECLVPRYKVYLWKGGNTRIAPIYKKIISQIAGRNIFE